MSRINQKRNADPVPTAANLPIYQQIASTLRRGIKTGQLVDGQPLPPERQLARQFGVSVVTLRKALQLLANDGMLRRRQGSGNYVSARADPEQKYGFFRIETLAGGGLPTADYLSVDLQPRPPRLPAFGTGGDVWRIRRLRALDSIPAVLEEIWLDGSCADQLNMSWLPESLYAFYQSELGFWISSAEDSVGVGTIPDWAPDIFGLAAGSASGVVDRRAWAQGPDAIEYSRSWFNPATARYVARLI